MWILANAPILYQKLALNKGFRTYLITKRPFKTTSANSIPGVPNLGICIPKVHLPI